jgi:large subunit ribosomal protein L19
MKAKKYTKETIRDIGIIDRNFPKFQVGDTIEVIQRIVEGGKVARTQAFEGDVIAIHWHGISSTFTIRRIGAGGVAVERVFPFYSPLVESIKYIRRGDVRRAKLYYLRDRVGRAARVKEKVMTKAQKASSSQAAS